MDTALDAIRAEYDLAVTKAWDNLARYKFSNFGYWSSRVVFLGQLLQRCGEPKPANPFVELVKFARKAREEAEYCETHGGYFCAAGCYGISGEAMRAEQGTADAQARRNQEAFEREVGA